MSTLAFELIAALEASEPPEARALQRDEVRLMVARRTGQTIVHTRFRQLPAYLEPGDLVVINNSATLPAAVPATRTDGTRIEVRFATRAPGRTDRVVRTGGPGSHHQPQRSVVELRSDRASSPLSDGRTGEQIQLPGRATMRLLAPYLGSGRLWLARTEGIDDLHEYLGEHGHPIRYRYVRRTWPLDAYQTVYASEPGSAEMPSAGRPFTAELLTRLRTMGVLIAAVTLHAGVSSPEAHEPPYPEEYTVPPATAGLVNRVRNSGHSVVAIGTTVVRALESAAAPDGTLESRQGWTNLVISKDHPVRVVDGLLTGWHEPRASHLQILEVIAGERLVRDSYEAALARGYLWHEFGDSHLILP